MSWRIPIMVVAFGLLLLPVAPVAAQTTSGPLLTVDAPTPNAQATVGTSLDIGGWSSGTQVTVNMDSNSGSALGTASVNEPRPDVAQVMNRPDLANSGFDVTWNVNGTNGSHTLYVTATGNGQSTTVQVPITLVGATAATNPSVSTNPNLYGPGTYNYNGTTSTCYDAYTCSNGINPNGSPYVSPYISPQYNNLYPYNNMYPYNQYYNGTSSNGMYYNPTTGTYQSTPYYNGTSSNGLYYNPTTGTYQSTPYYNGTTPYSSNGMYYNPATGTWQYYPGYSGNCITGASYCP